MRSNENYRRLLPALATFVVAGGCASTHMASTWHEANPQPIAFHRAVTVFASRSEIYRRNMEDKLASQFPNAVPSYKVLGSVDVTDANAVRRALANSRFDGAIVMRVADVVNDVNYTLPDGYYYTRPTASFAGYWGSAWGYPYDPGYYTNDVIISVETEIYSLTNTGDKLIWAGRTNTENPDSADKLGNSVIKHVKRELVREGLLLQ